MLLYCLGPQRHLAVADRPESELRLLLSDPLTVPPERWEFGSRTAWKDATFLAPILPGKLVGIGRNYVEHAREMDNAVPSEPLLFLKSPSSLIGPGDSVILPLESQRVEYEGEIAVVIGRRLRRASHEEAARGVFGVTAACDVTARDLQRKDATFARAKSFDTFCPLGPGILLGAYFSKLTVVTRINGEERQRGQTQEMVFGIVDLLVYTSRMMTLEPGDVVLTGTPGGVGALVDGDRVEVEVTGVGVLSNRVENWKQPAGEA